MKTSAKVLLLGILGGACFWALDTVLCFCFFHEGIFLDLVIPKVSTHHLSTRLPAILVAVILALVAGGYAAKRGLFCFSVSPAGRAGADRRGRTEIG